MAKINKPSQQELLERQKRIPKKTQEILGKMIGRRFAELCGAARGGNGQVKRKAKPYLPELWPGEARETGHAFEMREPGQELDEAEH